MIVVEGPDGGGKTTLLKSLEAELQWPIMPRVVSKETEPLVNLVKWVENDNLQPRRAKFLYDRHRLISEPIYGPAIRARTEPGFDDVIWLSRQMRSFFHRHPIIVFCLPPKKVVLSNVLSGPLAKENAVIGGSITQIYDQYVYLTSVFRAICPTLVYDYTVDGALKRAINMIHYMTMTRG